MLSKDYIKALRIIIDSLSNKKINWALIGSANLSLQGVDVDIEPDDIDISTDKAGAFLIEKALKEFVISPVEYSACEEYKFRSYFGRFKIRGVLVEVMGELENQIVGQDRWVKLADLSQKTIVKTQGFQIPAIPLERECSLYSKIGRTDTAQKIKQFLDQLNSNT